MPDHRDVVCILTRDQAAVEELRKALVQAGYRALVAKSLEELEGGTTCRPALVLLDRPRCSLDTLASGGPPSTGLVVSVWPPDAGCTEEQYVQDFDAGVDDVVSGQTPRQIVAKIRALLRRRRLQAQPPHVLAFGPLRMDLDKHEVTADGRPISLTSKEFAILQCFLAAPGRVFSRQDMLNTVWGEGYALEEHALDVHIHALRHKVESNPSRPTLILTVRGLGYKLKAR